MVDSETLTPGDSVYKAEFIDNHGDLTIICRRFVALRHSQQSDHLAITLPVVSTALKNVPYADEWEAFYLTPSEAAEAVIMDVRCKAEAMRVLADRAEPNMVKANECGSVSVTLENHATLAGSDQKPLLSPGKEKAVADKSVDTTQRMVRVHVWDMTEDAPLNEKSELWLNGYGAWLFKSKALRNGVLASLKQHDVGKEGRIALFPDGREGLMIDIPFTMTDDMEPGDRSTRDRISIYISDNSILVDGTPVIAATDKGSLEFARQSGELLTDEQAGTTTNSEPATHKEPI